MEGAGLGSKAYDFVRKYAGLPLIHHAERLSHEFLRQCERADEVQRDLLMSRLARHASSKFGKVHGLAEIKSPDHFRARVPIRGYDGHEPYIDEVRKGNLSALFGPGERVHMFAMTSGTTARPKTIPVTNQSLLDYKEGWLIWGITAFLAHPPMLDRGMLPVLQLASDWRESTTSGGIPCGAITGLTAHMQSPLVRITYCMPACASRIKHVESKYYVALRLSVYRNVGTIIAANPSTILAIARLGDREKETLIRDVRDGTVDAKWQIPDDVREGFRIRSKWKRKKSAKRLEGIVERTGRLLPKDYWPELQFVSNWTGGTMGAYLSGYPEFFGDKPVRDIGLIASEGRFTIPIANNTPAGVLDIRHHFFEFIPEELGDTDNPPTLTATELSVGGRYFIVPTTAGGLYRYHIHDLVECVGFQGKAPLLVFLNKGAHYSSLTGEKLSEFQVVAACNEAQAAVGIKLTSFILLPVWGDPPSYRLLVEEGDLPDPAVAARLASEFERRLQKHNLEYENKRETLRLAPIRIQRIPNGSWAEFQRRRLARGGGTVEQYKQPCLLADLEAIKGFTPLDEIEGA